MTSRPPSAPNGQRPEFLLDRPLAPDVAQHLRNKGWLVRTLEDVYGTKEAEQVPDQRWMQDAGTAGWPVLTKDKRVRRAKTEAPVLLQYDCLAFCLMHGQLKFNEQVAAFEQHREGILQVVERQKPGFWGVYRDRPLTELVIKHVR